MNVLEKFATVLTVVFSLCSFVLIAELIYVLWRRRRFRQQSISGSQDSRMSGATSYLLSKELLFFFCWNRKNQSSQVEPTATPTVLTDVSRDSEVAEEDDDLEKWEAVCGPSRLLYTIKEEEKEGRDSSEYSVESDPKSHWTLRDALAARVLIDAGLDAVDEVEAATPYYTPSPSPGREESVTPAESGASAVEEKETVTESVTIVIKDELSLAEINSANPTK